MIEGLYHIRFAAPDISADIIPTTIDIGREVGLSTAEGANGVDDESETFTYWARRYGSGEDANKRSTDSVETVVKKIAADEEGTIFLYHPDGFRVKVLFSLEEDIGWHSRGIDIHFRRNYFNPRARPEDVQMDFLTTLVALVRELAIETEPDYVWSLDMENQEWAAAVSATTKPIAEDISQLPWLGVYAPQTVADLGGRDYVLETPAWKVEELETGHILIVKSDSPLNRNTDPDEYLLGDSS